MTYVTRGWRYIMRHLGIGIPSHAIWGDGFYVMLHLGPGTTSRAIWGLALPHASRHVSFGGRRPSLVIWGLVLRHASFEV